MKIDYLFVRIVVSGAWAAVAIALVLSSSHQTIRAVATAVLVLSAWFLFWTLIDLTRAAKEWSAHPLPQGARPCERCGYDLRASTERCPECGTPIPQSELLRTPAVERLMSNAATEARAAGDDHVGTQHVLLALLNDKDSVASHVLKELGMDENAVRQTLAALDRASADDDNQE